MRVQIFIIFVVILILASSVLGLFRITKVQCETLNKSIIVIHQCECRPIRRGVSVFNLNVTVLQLLKRITVRFETYKKAGWYKPSLYNISLDACEFIKSRKHPLGNLIFNMFKNFSNINHNCPYIGETFIQGFYLKEDSLKNLPLSSAEYAVFLTWTIRKRLNDGTMCTGNYFQILLVGFVLINTVTGVFRVTQVHCEPLNSSLIIVNKCQCRAIKRGVTMVNLNGTILRPINDIEVRFQSFRKDGWYKPERYNGTINVCQFLKKRKNFFANLILNMIGDHTVNVNHPCPFVGDVVLKDFSLNENVLKNLPLPSAEYAVHLIWFFYKLHIGTIKIFFEYT